MNYHIDSGLIINSFKSKCACPICEIKKDLEEKLTYEFLNDAVMDDDCRISVGKKGFCAHHYDMLFNRQNKLSLALQMDTFNSVTLSKLLRQPKSLKDAKNIAKEIESATNSCVICDVLDVLIKKYCQTVFRLFVENPDFYKLIYNSNGFCMKHYAMLISECKNMGAFTKEYLKVLSTCQNNAVNNINQNVKTFTLKHDYRNSLNPLGSSEDALIDEREKLFGKIYK